MDEASFIEKYINLEMEKDVRTCPVIEASTVAGYIIPEMKKNAASNRALRMKTDYKSIFTKLKVLNEWASLVNYRQPWDHKKYIKDSFGEYSYDTQSNKYFLFDIWSNIHYGYVGKSIGISAWALLSGAGAAQSIGSEVPDGYIARRLEKLGDADVFSALDDPRDQIAINIGMTLWDRHQQNITTSLLMERIRLNTSGLIDS